MKKIALAIVGLALLGAPAFAQTNQVLSRNAVGYVKIEVPTNKFAMVGPVFQRIGGGNSQTIAEIIGSNSVPSGLQVFYWNPVAQTYAIAIYDSEDGWSAPATNRVPPGRGLFLKTPANASFTYYLMGEVPEGTNKSIVGTGGSGFNQFAYMYPVARAFSNITLSTLASGGDQVNIWNVSNQVYTPFNYDSEDGWPPALMSRVMQPGEAFFYRDNGPAVNWNEVKPYTWP